jgi:uncharacterized protein (DUF433 family)
VASGEAKICAIRGYLASGMSEAEIIEDFPVF